MDWLKELANSLEDVDVPLEHILVLTTDFDGTLTSYSARPLRRDACVGLFSMAAMQTAIGAD